MPPEQRPAPQPHNESEGQRINRELTEAAREAEERKADEAQEPGGKYIVDGRTVNAEGEEVK